MIDMEWLKRLIALVDESDIDSLEVSRLTTRVRISKSPSGPVVAAPASPPALPSGAPPVAGSGADGTAAGASRPAGPAEEPSSADGAEGADGGEDLHAVTSPMVGTFYRAPAPDAPPYVEVGDRVKKGQTLCILEAMKLMNELESEVSGILREISVQNSEPVEYGQVLFRIEADGTG